MTSDGSTPFKVLFLCAGNSARSVMAECIMNRESGGKFQAFSAGPNPDGEIHPHALTLLTGLGYRPQDMRSKSWQEFCGAAAPALDFVITVCDDTAKETCPYWEGQPISSHWGMPDPAAATGSEAEIGVAFAETYRQLANRIGIFVNLPIASLNRQSLQHHLDEIGQTVHAPQTA